MRFNNSRSPRRALAVFLALLALVAALPAVAAPQTLDRIVAVVNDGVILASDLQQEMTTVKQQLRQRHTPLPPDDVLRGQVLERLIMKKVQLEMADRVGVTVDDNTLNQALRRIADRNHLTLSQFRDALESQGMSFSAYRSQLRDEIIISRLRQRQVDNRVHVSPQEIDEHLATQTAADKDSEFLLGHILVALPEAASAKQIEAARAKAEAIRQSLLNGANFETTAAAKSDGQNALDGGRLGWRKASQLPTIFADQVLGMSVGDISQIIRSPSGFHIVKLLDRRSSDTHVVTQTHARHILIKTNKVVTSRDAEMRLESLRERIVHGEDFGKLAQTHSDDPASAANGGDLGWITPGTMVPAFQKAMDGLEPGQISQPFRTQYGWHIVQVLGRRKHDSTKEYRRAKAAKEIRDRKSEEALELWLRRLRDEAYVEKRLNNG